MKVTNHLDLLTAVQLALREVIGAYAIAVLEKDRRTRSLLPVKVVRWWWVLVKMSSFWLQMPRPL